MKCLTRAAVRELDRRAIEEFGVPGFVLMENAGRACAKEAQRLFGPAPSGPIVCLCGRGNNGGDGFVVARTLENRGVAARVLLLGSLAELEECTTDAAQAARLWTRGGGETDEWDRLEEPERERVFSTAGGFVDALFGTGLSRSLDESAADLVGRVNRAGRSTLAVDVPSGVDADTGAVLGVAVRARRTVTFVATKPGLTREPGRAYAGTVRVAEIGIPAQLLGGLARA